MGYNIIEKQYTTVEGEEANLDQYNYVLKQMQELAIRLLDAAPVEQFGQVERAELIQDLLASCREEYKDDTYVIIDMTPPRLAA